MKEKTDSKTRDTFDPTSPDKIIRQALENMNFQFHSSRENKECMRYSFSFQTTRLLTYVVIHTTNRDLSAQGVYRFPLIIPELKRRAVYELIGMINYKMGMGAFEMNHHTGELKLKSGIALHDNGNNSSDAVKKWINSSFEIMDHVFIGILAVAFGNAIPVESWSNIQNTFDPSLN